ncbi:MAG: phosphate ABC transporter permease subunit PstC [Candidatus Thorarchaeota archaeon]|nr:phosphate ABC transporter permease subunit PstC [Candidatus Thorarchaeota archaeon]
MTDKQGTSTEEAYAEDSTIEEIGFLQNLKNGFSSYFHDLRTAKGPARMDIFGRTMLIIPALASVTIITLILAMLWVESAPILLSEQAGIGIIVDTEWGPNRGHYGIAIFIAGTFLCASIAILIAIPTGVGGAIFLSEFCPLRIRSFFRTIIELMAAIPSIVYGLWAFTVLRFWVADLGEFWYGGDMNGLSLLSGGIILSIMLLPTVVTVSDDALQSVPKTYREASFALGATKSETARRIVLSAAIPGVGAAVVLSLGRAVGETMAILMVTGNSLQIPLTLFDPCYVMTSIITNQLGTAYVEPLWRSSLFSVALILMLMSVAFTLIAKVFISWGMKTRGMS